MTVKTLHRSEPREIRGLQVDASAELPTIYIYDEIGPGWIGMIDAPAIVDALREIGDTAEILVRLNSPGGSVFEAAAIYNHLSESAAKIRIRIDGVAASAASVIAMVGDEIEIAANAMIMIHEAWTIAVGNKAEIARTVTLLEKVDGTMVETYVARTGNTAEQINEWVAAETWFTADESVEHGFADTKLENVKAVTARVPKGRFKNPPASLEQYEPRSSALVTLADPPGRPGPDDTSTPAQPESRRAGYSVAAVAARARAARARVGQLPAA